MPESPPFPEPDVIRETAAAILRDPSFTTDLYEPPYSSVLRGIFDRLNALFQPLSTLFDKVLGLPPLVSWPLLILFAAVMALLGWHLAQALRGAFAKRTLREYRAADPDTAGNAGHWQGEAELAAGRGDFLTALRLLFRAGLLSLEKGKIRRAATNREYLRRYRNTAAEPPLRVFVQLIDYKWYGGRDCVAADWEAGQEAFRQLQNYRGTTTVRSAPDAGRSFREDV